MTAAASDAGSLSADPSLLEFAKHVKVPEAVAKALAEALGGGEDLTLEDFAFIAEDAVKRAAEGLSIDGTAATDLQRAQVNKLFHRARQSAAGAGLPVPGVIAPVASAAPAAPPPVEQPLLLKQSAFIDQTSEATFPLLGAEVIRGLRDRYAELVGDHPSSAGRPTDEQLSGLKAKLESGRVPYVDFAVFGPFDDQAARLRKFTDQVFVNGVLQTRLLHGPASFADWQGCWLIFKNAMIMLDAATLGSLNKYEEGLRQLWLTYGDWAVISQADVAMRSREWTIVHDELLQGKSLGSKPWSQVMQTTAFGEVAGPRAHWWWLHVVGPLTNKAGNSAQVVVDRLEQRPTNQHPLTTARAVHGSGGGGKAKAKASGGKPKSAEYCFSWNDGGCKHNCPEGRLHKCRFCEGPHRGKECPGRPAKGEGKSAAKNKKANRKRKAGKGDQSAFRP